jgi:hypothetical protein
MTCRVVLGFAFSCFLVSTVAAESVSGIYLNVHSSGAHSLVYIDENNGDVTIRLWGGHSGKREDVIVPSDCELLARGTLKGNSVIATYVFEDRVDDPYVHIVFGENELEVLNALPHFAGCGVYTRFFGKYKKHTCSEIKKIFSRDLGYGDDDPQALEDLCQ